MRQEGQLLSKKSLRALPIKAMPHLPKMSPLNPKYLTKKQSVFQKIAAFVEKFKGVDGQV